MLKIRNAVLHRIHVPQYKVKWQALVNVVIVVRIGNIWKRLI
jgi:hypothetical protein